MYAALLRIRKLAAVLVMLCFFFPLSQCTPHTTSDDRAHAAGSPAQPIVYVPLHVLIEGGVNALPVIALFAWPALTLFALLRARRRWIIGVLRCLDAALAGLSLYALSLLFEVYDEVRYGGVLLIAAYVAVLGCSLIAIAQLRTNGSAGATAASDHGTRR